MNNNENKSEITETPIKDKDGTKIIGQKLQKGTITISVFNNEQGKTYAIQKGYKKKETSQWINTAINLFEKEKETLKELINKL